ncbi:MAG: hypothetical protein IMZ51_03825 [Chloroflexi bacterium]|nr:hypothetical protein [Chloroflexota bacterium]
MAKKGIVEQLGPDAQRKAIRLSVSGMSSQSIADELNKEYQSEITSNQVSDFLRRKQKDTSILLKEDKNWQVKVKEEFEDTVKQLKDLNAEVWKFFYELRKNPEYKDKIIVCKKCKHRMILQLQSYGLLLKTADTILKQIEHIDKVMGKLQKKSLNINYNYVDLSKKIGVVLPNLLQMMEKKGIVKLNKKRLKVYYGNKIEPEIDDEEDEDDEDDT